MLDAIQCLRAEGMKTALLTNNFWMDRAHRIPTQPLDPNLFDVIIVYIQFDIHNISDNSRIVSYWNA